MKLFAWRSVSQAKKLGLKNDESFYIGVAAFLKLCKNTFCKMYFDKIKCFLIIRHSFDFNISTTQKGMNYVFELITIRKS
jgi:hypothetical protein